MVVVVGLTPVDPLAAADVKVPGVMATLVAPVVDQLNVLLDPEAMVAGLARNELMTGLPTTVTVTVAVVDPAPLVAVSV